MTKVNIEPSMSRLVRLGILMQASTPKTLVEKLNQANVTMTPNVAAAMGDLMVFLGLTSASSFDQLSHMVCEIASGFVVRIEHKNASQYQHIAACFGHSFNRGTAPLDPRDLAKLHIAFLVGISLAYGKASSLYSSAKY